MPQDIPSSKRNSYDGYMFRHLLFATCCGFLGAGCVPASFTTRIAPIEASLDLPLLPGLRLHAPPNGTQTASSSVLLIGETNMPNIWIEGRSYAVIQGVFSIPFSLHVGKNTILLETGNGHTTTSLPLMISRILSQ